jgi:hypothetical protein
MVTGPSGFGSARDVSPALPRCTLREDAILTAVCRLDCSDVDLFHLHHRIERALGGGGIGIGYRFRQSHRRNLPGQAPFVLARRRHRTKGKSCSLLAWSYHFSIVLFD